MEFPNLYNAKNKSLTIYVNFLPISNSLLFKTNDTYRNEIFILIRCQILILIQRKLKSLLNTD